MKRILSVKLIFVFVFIAGIASAKKNNPTLVQRIEPTFWYTEMQNHDVQIMLYGANIQQATVQIDYPGVQISRIEHTNNPNYKFIYLNIAKGTQPGNININVKQGKLKQLIHYPLKVRKPNSANRISFSEADAIYLLMPDRFVNGNPKNDSISGYHQGINRTDLSKRHGGDIEGIIGKIPYMADLGITALWTTPFFDNNDKNYSYHHYGCSDYYKIDPRFGKNEDYVRLADSCHAYGMKLIIDVVPNHCSSAHWWMADKPAKDWFNEWPQFTGSNYRMTAWTDPYAAKSDLMRLTNGWFAPNMPDFNLNNKLLFDYLTQVYIFWIEYVGINGMRVDTYPYNDIETAARFIQIIRNEYPKMQVVGECWVKTPAETAFYQSGNNNKNGFDSRLQSVMDFCLKDALSSAFNENDGWDTGVARFYAHFAQDFVYPNPNMIMNFLDNHDIDRYSTAVKRDVTKYKMGLAMLMTLRGYPQLYAGTEIMIDGIAGTYEGHRFDFPGGWQTDKRNAFTAAGRTAEENEIFNYTRALLNYRKNNPVLQSGKMKQFVPADGLYVFFRYNNEKIIMVIANNNSTAKPLLTGRFDEMLNGKSTVTNIISNEKMPLATQIEVPAKTVLILEVE